MKVHEAMLVKYFNMARNACRYPSSNVADTAAVDHEGLGWSTNLRPGIVTFIQRTNHAPRKGCTHLGMERIWVCWSKTTFHDYIKIPELAYINSRYEYGHRLRSILVLACTCRKGSSASDMVLRRKAFPSPPCIRVSIALSAMYEKKLALL